MQLVDYETYLDKHEHVAHQAALAFAREPHRIALNPPVPCYACGQPATFHGLQQYWTPPALAQWLYDMMVELYGADAINQALVCDLTAGAGNLLQPYEHSCGVEVDRTVITPGLHIVNADLVTFYPYLRHSGFHCQIMALNPPYAEYWPRAVFFPDALEGEQLESQIATILAGSSLLCYQGMGYAIVSTKILPKLHREFTKIIAILRITDVFHPHADVEVTVVFFKGSNAYLDTTTMIDFGTLIMDALPTPMTVATRLSRHAFRWYVSAHDEQKCWNDAYTLYKSDQHHHAWTYNLEVHGPRVRLSFTNYQRKVLNQKPSVTPLSYYVFNPDQLTTIRQQIANWNTMLPCTQPITIDPALDEALAHTKRRSDRQLTPYYPLKPVQTLGWYHTMTEIRCIQDAPEHGFSAGHTYPITTWVAQGSESRSIDNTASTTLIETRWRYLMIQIEGDHGSIEFTEDQGANILLTHFELPEVVDVAAKYPDEYAQNLLRVETLQARYQFKEYQKDLLARILTKRDGALRTLLSAEQGMGKTRMSLALIELLGVKKALMVTKTKVVTHFPAEAQRVKFPQPVQVIDDIRSAVAAKHAQTGVFVVSYATLHAKSTRGRQRSAVIRIGDERRPKRVFLNGKTAMLDLKREPVRGTVTQSLWLKRFKGIYAILKNAFRSGVVILDETTTAKKRENKVSQAAYSLHARHRVGLSGEPIDNYLNDIYWTCIWLFGENNPLFPYARKTAKQFIDDYLKVEYKTIVFEHQAHDKKATPKILPEIANVALLWKLIAPLFIVRRWSDLDADQMVALHIRLWDTPFALEQLNAYAEWQEAMKTFIRMMSGKSNGNGFVHTVGGYQSKLRLMVCLPNADSLRYAVGRDEHDERREWQGKVLASPFTPKVERVLTLITDCLSHQQQCVLMTMYKEEAAFYTEVLRTSGIRVETVTGDVSPTKLTQINHRFQSGAIQVVVATILACAEGIDWNWCSRMIFTTTTWRASKLRQAMHRCRRINSTQDVTIDLVLTKESIDWRAYNLQLRKGRSSDMCLQGAIKQEYEPHDATTLMYEAVKHIEFENQEAMAAIEMRCRDILTRYAPAPPPRLVSGVEPVPTIQPLPVTPDISAHLAAWHTTCQQTDVGRQMTLPW